jgi:hypothetical protein
MADDLRAPRESERELEEALGRLEKERRRTWRGRYGWLAFGIVLLFVVYPVCVLLGYAHVGIILVPVGLGTIAGMLLEMLIARLAE